MHRALGHGAVVADDEGAGVMSGVSMTEKWPELQGVRHWEGLLDPLDDDLRRSIIRYGEMVMVTYEAFIAERKSPHAGMCRWSRADILRKADVSHPELYEVTRYLYATATDDIPAKWFFRGLSREAQDRECNWMGYVAVATDTGVGVLGRRDVVVAWRGTQEALEWLDDIEALPAPAAEILGDAGEHDGAHVHRGYLSIYTSSDSKSKYRKDSARSQVLKEIDEVMNKYKDEAVSITVVGHSLGASIAHLNAIDIAANGHNKPAGGSGRGAPVTAIVFGSPRVGNHHFKHIFENAIPDLRLLRVRNAPDLIPDWPPVGYPDIGVELRIDTRKSKSLKPPSGVGEKHDLEVYMHGVAGWQGNNGDFHLAVERDVALCNKYADVLVDDHPVPAGWRVLKNKGMKRLDDGRWMLEDHETDYLEDLLRD